MTFRYNYVDALQDVISQSRTSSAFTFDTAGYTITNKTNSGVLQVNSVFGAESFNQGRVGYQTIKDVRAVPVAFPSIYVCKSPNRTVPGDGTYNLVAGTERSSGANSLDQKILEVTDDFTLIKGNHTITVGTHNEFFKFDNLFVQDVYGTYFFNSINAPGDARQPQSGNAVRYQVQFGTPIQRPAPSSVPSNGASTWATSGGSATASTVNLGHPGGPPAAHRQAHLQPARLQYVRRRHQQRAQRPADHLAPPRVQLERRRVGQGSGARRGRRLRGPHPVRLDLEQLR